MELEYESMYGDEFNTAQTVSKQKRAISRIDLY